ncbi:MAG: hypothetical protein ACLUGD_04110 [Ruminococcus sp.]
MTEEKLAELYCECRNAANLYLWDGEKQCYISGKERQVSVASRCVDDFGEAIEDQAAVNLLRRVETISEAEKMVTPYMYHNYIAALLLVGRKNGSAENGSILGRHDRSGSGYILGII